MVHYDKIHWINAFSHQILMSSCLNKLELTGVHPLPPTLSLSLSPHFLSYTNSLNISPSLCFATSLFFRLFLPHTHTLTLPPSLYPSVST